MFEGLFSRFKRDTIIKESNEDLSLDDENVINEIKDFMASKKRQWMITGEKYYDGKHDILKRKRTVIGQDGKLEEIDNLPNKPLPKWFIPRIKNRVIQHFLYKSNSKEF